MPSGSRRTGLKIPNTPGSRRSPQIITRIGKLMSKGVDRCIVPRSLSQRCNHQKRLARNPQIHTPKRRTEIMPGCHASIDLTGVSDGADAAKGWLIVTTIVATWGGADTV